MSVYVGLKQGKVHEKREMSEYYCGGCGWPVTDHDSYCRECGGAFQESFATERWNDTRWHDMFGTPERAAMTITRMQMATDLMGCCDADSCPAAFNECWKLDLCPMDDYDALLEWLKGASGGE